MEVVRFPDQVFFGRFQQIGGNLLGLGADLARGDRRGGPGCRRAAAGVGAQAIRSGVGVAFFDFNIGGGNADFLGDDLGIGGLVTLALRLGSKAGYGFAGRVNADFT